MSSAINLNSDIGFTCPGCGFMATGKAMYADELIQGYNRHEPCFRVEVKVRGMFEPISSGGNNLTEPSGEGENTSEQTN